MASANEAPTAPTAGYEPIAAVSTGGYEPIAQWSDPFTILAPDVYRNKNLGYIPHRGDVFWFKSAHHAIYDTFPNGRNMRANDSFVDLTNTIIGEQSLVAEIPVEKRGVRHDTRLSPYSLSTVTKCRCGPTTAETAERHGCGRT